jgi:pimeloyl-ACP methyl ester carboxylesterase
MHKILGVSVLVLALPAFAQTGSGNWLDLLLDLGDGIASEVFGTQQNQRVDEPDPVLPRHIPQHWHAEYLREPVFNSKILLIEAGNHNAESVLLVHGLGQGGSRIWYDTIRLLEKNYHVVTLDLPGFGYSQTPPGRYSPANYAAVLNWLVQEKFSNKPIVVGHSMGGAIVLMYGARYPQQLKHAVLVDVAGILHRVATVKYLSALSLPPDAASIPGTEMADTIGLLILGDTIGEIAKGLPDPTPILNKSDVLWNITMQGRPNINAGYSLIETDFSREIKRFIAPATLIWGENDPVTPLRTGRLLVAKMPNAVLHAIPNGGHVPMQATPDVFNKLLLQGLRQPPQVRKESASDPGKTDLVCKNRKNETYSGNYDTVLIDNCVNIVLRTISAKQLMIRNSIVQLESISINGPQTACSFEGSTVLATDLACNGEVGLYSDQSRLDLAGADISGTRKGISITGESYLVISVSALKSPLYSGDIHNVFTLANRALEEYLLDRRPALGPI